jgi:hypothetical protein
VGHVELALELEPAAVAEAEGVGLAELPLGLEPVPVGQEDRPRQEVARRDVELNGQALGRPGGSGVERIQVANTEPEVQRSGQRLVWADEIQSP